MVQSRLLLFGAAALALVSQAPSAQACGGFFCGRMPVDQTAERILFEIGDDSVTMTTQISYNGAAEDFAWVLPLLEVPDPDSLAVFSQRALTGLDAASGPIFYSPCAPVLEAAGGGGDPTDSDGGVTVHIRAEVGDYEVAVIESTDPAALVDWLRAEDYRVTEPMEPYIELYTNEGMKFLALKLLETADVMDLKPFRFSMPGNVPSIPLRMTSLAAEPEMSVVVFILGDQRYEAKNWENVTIDESELRYDPYTWPALTNWPALVAKGVDEAGGQGWVTEFAGSTESYLTQIQAQIETDNFNAEEDREAAHALLEVLEPHPYLTRLYSRLSAEEMTSDPIFGRSGGDDVDQVHEIQAAMDGTDACNVPTDPCDFVTCGAGGTCRTAVVVDDSGTDQTVTGCGCVPGATARTTFAPDGSATVICQDQRMSFLNAGDQEAGMETIPDGCAGFDCGEHGTCLPVNMTPTCVCEQGYIAVGNFTEEGQRTTTCIAPTEAIEASFYDRQLPALPANMPGGRDDVMMPSGGSGGGSATSTTSSTPSTSSGGTAADPADPATPVAMADAKHKSSDGGCSMGSTGERPAPLAWLGLVALGLVLTRQRRSVPETQNR